ncbi:acetoacetate decarboxylase family protein [Propionivibrio soli]|uniref:acetoacetate decarboxylase family protein n=1 Tax=Propionivibrio soli TaxID=2976531 RepID=UPI0021E8915F|nr:acetoacetate decarboxylase family protein [Propionivibrio soli]
MNTPAWINRSFTPPFTTTGVSALVPPPPWHYAGWLINVEFSFDRDRARSLVPETAGSPTGTGCVHFADWQACTDGHELLDPILAQYRETIVVLELERPDGSHCMYCPAIWVDQDVSLLRGLLQGWPKKMGSTWLTRSLPIDHPAAAPLRAGTRLGASLAVKDRRVIDAQAVLTGAPGRPLGFLSMPTLGAVGWPDLRCPATIPEPTIVRPDIRDRVQSEWYALDAALSLYPHPTEELHGLGTIAATEGSAGWIALTIEGARDA